MRSQLPEAGEEITTRGRTITETDITQFACLTGDLHPQHTDAEWSGSRRFGRRVAHGLLVVSYAVGLMPFDPERVVALRGLDGVTFKRPVLIGDTIRVHSRVAEIKPFDSEHAMVAFAWRILNQDDRLVVRAQVNAVWKVGDSDQAKSPESNGAAATDLYEGSVLL